MDKVYEFLCHKIGLKDNDSVVIGVSYGPDSMALLNLLLEIRKKIGLKIVVAHVNHNLRKASKKEKELLEKYCFKNDLIFEHILIEEYTNDNFHNEARKIRYDFFEELVKKYGAKYLMTAHHADDLIETVLMRISRGSNLKGYSGFIAIVDKGFYRIVRPLIFVTKKEILNYLQEKNIPYALDLSNNNSKYTRNRYRKYILPFLKKEDINIHEKYLKFSRILLENDEYINKMMFDHLAQIYCDDKIVIDKFKQLDQLMQKRIIEYLISQSFMDDLFLVNDTHLESILKLIYSKKANSEVLLPNYFKVVKTYNHLTFIKEDVLSSTYNIQISDIVFLPNGKSIKRVTTSSVDGNDICRLTSSDLSLPLYVRNRKDGDRIEIKNSQGHTKIKDIFIDQKIPMKERSNWPVVVDSYDNVVWLPGLKKSKYNRLKTDTCDIILKYE